MSTSLSRPAHSQALGVEKWPNQSIGRPLLPEYLDLDITELELDGLRVLAERIRFRIAQGSEEQSQLLRK